MSKTQEYRIEFEGEQTEEVARAIKDGISVRLEGEHADEVVVEVGEVVSETVAEAELSDDVVRDVGDVVSERMLRTTLPTLSSTT